MNPEILILGAMDVEIARFVDNSDVVEVYNDTSGNVYIAEFENNIVCITKTGVGKVFSAAKTQRLLSRYNFKEVIFTGIAGAVSHNLEIGDVVIGTKCVQHDLDISHAWSEFSVGELPNVSHDVMFPQTCKDSIDILMQYKPEGFKTFTGIIATGDVFLNHANSKLHLDRIKTTGAIAVEMEGSSVGTICAMNDVPYTILRAISDKIYEKSVIDFQHFADEYSNHLFDMVRYLIRLRSR